ncbi:MFS transporter [Granulosicoccus sp. 3-233]|uniref:MFS transporter n=1 Tax=Granulosicoccus sp. 3-233 TaxID=3417969 RepID=UPI003D334322
MSDSSISLSSPVLMRRPWQAVTAMFLLNGALFGAWASRIPTVAERFSLDAGTLGFVLLALAFGAILSFPLAGGLCERYGAAFVTRTIAVLYALSLVGIAAAPALPLLVLAIILFGAAHGSMDVAMNAWAAEVEREIGASVMSGFHAMFSLGAGLGAASGFAAVRFGLDVSAHFLLLSLVLLTLALLLSNIPGTNRKPVAAVASSSVFLSVPRGTLFFVGMVAFGISLGEGAMADWSAIYLVSVAGSPLDTAALGYACFSTMMVVLRLLGDRVVSLLGPVVTVRVSAVCAMSGVALAVIAATPLWSLCGFALMGAGYAIVMPLVFSRAANDPDTPPGPAIAGVATLAYGGMLLGPPVIGFLAELIGLRAAFLLLAALALLTALLAGHLRLEQSEGQGRRG